MLIFQMAFLAHQIGNQRAVKNLIFDTLKGIEKLNFKIQKTWIHKQTARNENFYSSKMNFFFRVKFFIFILTK